MVTRLHTLTDGTASIGSSQPIGKEGFVSTVGAEIEWSRAGQDTRKLQEDISRVIAIVKRAVSRAEVDAQEGHARLSIKSVDLTLRAVVVLTGGAEFKFKLFGLELGGGVELSDSDTQTIEISLTPSPEEARAFAEEDVADRLAHAIRAIRNSVAEAAAVPPRFELGEGSVELNFQADESGSIKFIVAGEGKRTNAHTIKLTLVPT